ncbi:Ig-like domain-containing protein [Acidothermaceae bacterium B102]|nr:Ig-like domain-containing protein [Acidothermaceae bacterium B102]
MSRHIAVGVATLSMVAAFTGGAASSRADVIGNLTVTPATGDDTAVMTLTTSGPCLNGTNLQVFVTGAGFPAGGYPVTASAPLTSLTTDASGALTTSLTDTMRHFASVQSPPATLSGTYVFSARCTSADGATVYDSFNENVVYTVNPGAAPTYVASVEVQFGYFTATALSASPAGPVPSGTPVTFTAHVSSTPLGGALGTVQLMDGAAAVGSPTTVDSSGNAAVATSLTGAGNHTITAVFTGKFGFITGSTSPPLVLVVQPAVADPTATSLAITPPAATAADPVTLTASVADVPHPGTRPVGTIQFADAGVSVGTTQPVAPDGTASYSHTFAAGSHSFTASFVPTDSTAFGPSSSTSQVYVVTAAAAGGQTIETTVDAGSLTISVADTSTVVLNPPVLNPAATFLTTSGSLHHVTVTDTRAGSPGWAVSGQLSDFHALSGPPTSLIPGVDLGWAPAVVDTDPGQTVLPGAKVLPAAPPLTSDPTTAGSEGLHVSRQLATAAPGAGTGTAHLGATLTLNVPTSVAAGTYDAVLTLTAI